MMATAPVDPAPALFELANTEIDPSAALRLPHPHRQYVPDEKKQKDPAVVVNIPASPSAQALEVVATVTRDGYFVAGEAKAAAAKEVDADVRPGEL